MINDRIQDRNLLDNKEDNEWKYIDKGLDWKKINGANSEETMSIRELFTEEKRYWIPSDGRESREKKR